MEENTTFEIISDEVITIAKEEYDALRRKAQCLDIIEADIRMKIDQGENGYSLINDDLILLLTGMKAYQRDKLREVARRAAARLKAQTGKDEADE
jgi:hypothetical protein